MQANLQAALKVRDANPNKDTQQAVNVARAAYLESKAIPDAAKAKVAKDSKADTVKDLAAAEAAGDQAQIDALKFNLPILERQITDFDNSVRAQAEAAAPPPN